MKNLFAAFILILSGVILAASVSSFAQTYPTTTPTYIPNAVKAPVAVVSGVNSTFNTNGISITTVQFGGTCTGLNANLQGTADGTNYVPVQGHLVGGSSSTSVPASGVIAVSTTGAWRINTSGLSKIRVGAPMQVSSVAVGCTVAETGTAGAILE